jgi:hypothetical protein
MATKVNHHAWPGNGKTQGTIVKIEDRLQMVSFSESEDRISREGLKKFTEM